MIRNPTVVKDQGSAKVQDSCSESILAILRGMTICSVGAHDEPICQSQASHRQSHIGFELEQSKSIAAADDDIMSVAVNKCIRRKCNSVRKRYSTIAFKRHGSATCQGGGEVRVGW